MTLATTQMSLWRYSLDPAHALSASRNCCSIASVASISSGSSDPVSLGLSNPSPTISLIATLMSPESMAVSITFTALGPRRWSCARAPSATNRRWRDPARVLQTALRRLGLPALRGYDLRHTCATLLLQAGVPAKVAAERLGHSSIVLTLNTYSHVTSTMQADANERLEAMIPAAVGTDLAFLGEPVVVSSKARSLSRQ